MPLAPGSRLGPYEITGPLGAGGMGEVYRARDVRLHREVAIKVLPADAADHARSRERFEREARLVSSLNHRNICTLHDVGTEGDTDYLVMELLEGETLADRLERGPLKLDESLRVGGEIAEALAAAHRAGVVHRDLKPGNVMLTRGGTKVLDFGIAKMAEPAPDGGGLRPTAGPTRTTPLTGAGRIVGTLNYMAPEQLEGKPVDHRADIFAFGAVLYEMLTGRRAFDGASPASVIAGILERDPAPPASIVPSTPPALDRLVRDCLAKDPDLRRQSAHDVASELRGIAEAPVAVARSAPPARGSARFAWSVAAVAVLAALVLAALSLRQRGAPGRAAASAPVVEFEVPGVSLFENSPPAVSPDGRAVAYAATAAAGGPSFLYVRRIDDARPRAVEGTEGAMRPFWSGDGREIAYFDDGKLLAVAVDGGHPRTICAASYGVGGTWSAGGTIVFATAFYNGLLRVDAAGGAPRPITTLDAARGEAGHLWPVFLPDGRHVLFVSRTVASEPSRIERVGIDGGPRTVILEADALAGYSAPWLVFAKGGALFAQRFDPDSAAVSGERRLVADDVYFDENIVSVWAHIGADSLAWSPHRPARVLATWYGADGQPRGTAFEETDVEEARISPDGGRVALAKYDPTHGGADLWIHDTARSVTTRLTSGAGNENLGPWTPDGRSLLYTSDDRGPYVVYRVPADGSADPRPILREEGFDWWTGSLSPDGTTFYAHREGGRGDVRIFAVPLDAPERRTVWTAGSDIRMFPMDSPDGRAVAYVSDRSGRWEVYARRTGSGAVIQLSVNGTTRRPPRWTRDGRAVWFEGLDETLHRVAVRVAGDGLAADPPDPAVAIDAKDLAAFDTAPDGRLLVLRNVSGGKRGLVVRVGWTTKPR